MATKNYMINDKWLDLDKQNIVELQSVDGVQGLKMLMKYLYSRV